MSNIRLDEIAKPRRFFLRACRLENALRAFVGELDSMPGGKVPSGGCWKEHARCLIEEANTLLMQRRLDAAWHCYVAATRLQVYRLHDPQQLKAEALVLRAECDQKLEGWRKKGALQVLDMALGHKKLELEGLHTVTTLLRQDDIHRQDKAVIEMIQLLLESPEATPTPTLQTAQNLIYLAMFIRDEHNNNQYFKIASIQQTIIVLVGMLVVSLAWVLYLQESSWFTGGNNLPGGSFPGGIALFGSMGGTFSAIHGLLTSGTKNKIPMSLTGMLFTMSRPFLGAIGALVIYVILVAKILSFGELTAPLVLAAAFAAGFSERLVIKAVERFTGNDTTPSLQKSAGETLSMRAT